jgi:hypothetical protein
MLMLRPQLQLLTLALFMLNSCVQHKEDEIGPSYPLHQTLTIKYQKHNQKLICSAQFKKNNEWGDVVQLTGKSRITFNDRAHTQVVHNNGITYVWESSQLPLDNKVDFKLIKSESEFISNQLSLNDTFDIDLKKNGDRIEKSSDFVVAWIGKPIQENDEVTVYLKQGAVTSKEMHQSTHGATDISIPFSELINFESGPVELTVLRKHTINSLNWADKEAGGKRSYIVEQRRVVQIR